LVYSICFLVCCRFSSLYSVIQQHQATIEQQRIRCEQSDAQFASVSSKLKGAEKEMVRLRLLLDKEHDSNERHISALKGQLAIKSDEVLAKDTRLRTLEDEYTAHKAEYESRISVLEKDRSILEAVNFELRAEREKNYNLQKENDEMKQTVLAKAHLEGQYTAALEQNENLSKTVSRLEDERAQWVAERRELDQQLGEKIALTKQLIIERDALQIEVKGKETQLVENHNEHQRKLSQLSDAKEAKELILQTQLADRDALITRAQSTIDQLQKENGDDRAAKKELLDKHEELEATIRDLQKELTERTESLESTQKQLSEVQQQLDTLQKTSLSTNAGLEAELARHKRTRSSRWALVEKLDQGYHNSYMAQIFMKWKHEWRVQEKERTVLSVQAERAALHARTAQVEEEKERTLESIKAMESALQAERDEAAEAVRRAQQKWEAEQARKLEQCKTDWEREQILARDVERREKLEREARIAEERQKVREEVEEARRIELAALNARGGHDTHAHSMSVTMLCCLHTSVLP
jgi:chromosome segregation ATPase